MNKELLKGNWNILKGKVKQKWGKLTDNDISTIDGNYDELIGHLQKAYGYDQEACEREIDSFIEESKSTRS